MVSKKTVYMPSTNGKNQLYVQIWEPMDAPICGILQLSHGMVEYIDRYDEFASFLAEQGLLVVGNDHLGHGHSVNENSELGYFNAEDSSKTVVDDLHAITVQIKKDHPHLPFFLLGHSMGSFIARRYIMTYGDELNGAIIMGTGQLPNFAISMAKPVLHLLKKIKGEHYRSKTLNNLSFGAYNKQFKPTRTTHDWLSNNTEAIDRYLADPYCTFLFTLNGYELLLKTFDFIGKKKNINKIPKTLPLLFISGNEDPVGGNGKIVKRLYEQYTSAGINDTSLKLYDKDRHELLQELDRLTIFKDIYNWLKPHLHADSLDLDQQNRI